MRKIQPQGPYRIIGYSYGACIGFEMATMLQESDGEESIERLILLDGSHLYMQTYRNVSVYPVLLDLLKIFPSHLNFLVLLAHSKDLKPACIFTKNFFKTRLLGISHGFWGNW